MYTNHKDGFKSIHVYIHEVQIMIYNNSILLSVDGQSCVHVYSGWMCLHRRYVDFLIIEKTAMKWILLFSFKYLCKRNTSPLHFYGYGYIVFNATFSNISVISWRPAASHRHTLLHNVVSSTPRLSVIRTHNVNGDR